MNENQQSMLVLTQCKVYSTTKFSHQITMKNSTEMQGCHSQLMLLVQFCKSRMLPHICHQALTQHYSAITPCQVRQNKQCCDGNQTETSVFFYYEKLKLTKTSVPYQQYFHVFILWIHLDLQHERSNNPSTPKRSVYRSCCRRSQMYMDVQVFHIKKFNISHCLQHYVN